MEILKEKPRNIFRKLFFDLFKKEVKKEGVSYGDATQFLWDNFSLEDWGDRGDVRLLGKWADDDLEYFVWVGEFWNPYPGKVYRFIGLVITRDDEDPIEVGWAGWAGWEFPDNEDEVVGEFVDEL